MIGGYWTRSNDVEIDIVGADREPVARQLLFLGSIKWLETGQFDDHDLVALQRHRDRVTSDPVPLIAVSRSGTATNRIDAAFTPRRPAGGVATLTGTSPGMTTMHSWRAAL